MWLEFIKDILEVCIVPIIGVIGGYIIAFVNKKREQMEAKVEDETLEKYIGLVSNLITDCVAATQQTYVQALKDKDMFDENAQKEALEMTFNAVKSLLSDKATECLLEAFTDLDSYIKYKIEAEINKNKGTV